MNSNCVVFFWFPVSLDNAVISPIIVSDNNWLDRKKKITWCNLKMLGTVTNHISFFPLAALCDYATIILFTILLCMWQYRIATTFFLLWATYFLSHQIHLNSINFVFSWLFRTVNLCRLYRSYIMVFGMLFGEYDTMVQCEHWALST